VRPGNQTTWERWQGIAANQEAWDASYEKQVGEYWQSQGSHSPPWKIDKAMSLGTFKISRPLGLRELKDLKTQGTSGKVKTQRLL